MAQTLAALGAVMFLMVSAPEAAAPEFNACDQCYEGLTYAECAGRINYIVSSCCGPSGGWAWCVNSSWGYYSRCNHDIGGGECRCNLSGDCDSQFRMHEVNW